MWLSKWWVVDGVMIVLLLVILWIVFSSFVGWVFLSRNFEVLVLRVVYIYLLRLKVVRISILVFSGDVVMC